MTTFQNQLIQLVHDLKHSHHKDSKNHLTSSAFENMVEKVKNTTLDNFDIPTKFPQITSEGYLYCQNDIRISLFFVPKGTKIPIHDHPKMFVICKVLKGKLVYNQFQLENKTHQITAPQKYLESLITHENFVFPHLNASKTTKIIQQNSINYITPEANLHQLQAIQDSIFMDVICPDYDQVQIFLNIYEECKKIGKEKVILQMRPPKLKHTPTIPVGFK